MSRFLDASAARIVETDDRGPHQQGLVHHLADLLGVRHRQGSTKHCKVLTWKINYDCKTSLKKTVFWIRIHFIRIQIPPVKSDLNSLQALPEMFNHLFYQFCGAEIIYFQLRLRLWP